jgi:tRNA dimethylallyltransferase
MGHAMSSGAAAKGAVLIAGPTASGKSALALALAERLGGTIINADSMQVYRDLRIITARPTPFDEARAPHILYGHVDAAENYSAGRWRAEAGAALAAAEKTGRLPILVGGTGLYFKSLTMGLAPIPPVPAEIRAGQGSAAHEGSRSAACRAYAARPSDRWPPDARGPSPRHPGAGSGHCHRPIADRLAG